MSKEEPIIVDGIERVWDNKEPAFQTKVILETTWTDIPKVVYDEIRDMWRDYELGNDYYYLGWDAEMDETYPETAKYIRDNNVDEENLLIHFWW